MNRWIVALLVLLSVPLALSSAALAGPNAGGTLILHQNPTLAYTADHDYCGEAGLASCDQADVNAPADPECTVVFFAFAAFPPDASPRLKALAFGIEYDAERLVLLDHGACAGFELSDNGWPVSGTGTALVLDSLATGGLTPVYWFAAAAYSEGDTASFALVPHPVQGGAFADDAIPAVIDTVTAYGRLGFGTPGALPCPAGGDSPGGGEDAPQEGEGEQDGAPDAPSFSGELTFVEMTTTADSTFALAARALRAEYGLRVLVGMSPDGLVCRASQTQRDAMIQDGRVNIVTEDVIGDRSELGSDDLGPGDPGFAARVWNAMFEEDPPDTSGGRGFAPGDTCLYFGDNEERITPPSGPDNQTSVYMLGDIGVSLIYMESDQSGPCQAPNYPEDWTPTERNLAFGYIQQGLTDLANLAADGYVTFWIAETPVCSTSVEPIQLSHGNTTWVNEAMDQLGFNQGTTSQKMRALCNTRRARAITPYDWWFITFVIADDCDSDHRFSDDWISFGSYFGPRTTLLYLNGSGQTYQLDDLDLIAIHETCHAFGAPDEYYFTGSCVDPWGYLRVPNGNDTTCVAPEDQYPCIMENGLTFELCPYTRAHLGWRDSDDPTDHVYDPIDHLDSDMSLLAGFGDSVSLGDQVDIYAGSTWVKRLIGSEWSSSRGRVLWDGIGYDGLPRTPGAYSWKRNNGTAHDDTLRSDTEPPVVTDLWIRPGSGGLIPDTLAFRFEDPDTRSGRVRATASLPGWPDVAILEDRFFRDTQSAAPVEKTYRLTHDGLWTVTVRVWDVGDGHEAAGDSAYWHGSLTGVGDERIFLPELTLSRGRPNPSSSWIAWDLALPEAGTVDLRVVAVDGRSVKAWANRTLPGGVTKILWDGRDGNGTTVACGRYFLVVTDRSGRTRSMPATIIR